VKKDTEAAYCSAKVKMEHIYIYNRTNTAYKITLYSKFSWS